MSTGSMVVYRDYRIGVTFAERTYDIGHTFLHLGVCSLYGIKLNGIGILACSNRRHCTATHADTIIVASHHNDTFAAMRMALDRITGSGVPYPSGQHHNLVVGILNAIVRILKCEYRPTYQRLTVLIAEVTGTIAGLNQYFGRRLI